MKRLLTLLFLWCFLQSSYAQRGTFTQTFMKDLEYRDGTYTANLKQNVFGDLIFTDSKGNAYTYEQKYLNKHFSEIGSGLEGKRTFMKELIRKSRRERDYQIRYSIDIFGEESIRDNRGYQAKKGKDIHGEYFEESDGEFKTAIKRNFRGELEYQENDFSATLGKDIFGKWSYKDSDRNEIQFSQVTWDRLLKRFGSDKDILWFMIDKMFALNEKGGYGAAH